jgi:Dienelactone hydrolase family
MFAIDDSSANNGVAAVISFHGGLGSHIFDHRNKTAVDKTDDTKPKMLVLSGGEDDMTSDIQLLEETLNAAGNEWEITRYWGIQHAWTNFDDSLGRYNEWADITSWNSMIEFLTEVFAEISFEYEPLGIDGIEAVNYTDLTDGKALRGYLARPDSTKFQGPHPAVVIVP